MTQEEKQILLKDLCARLPYGVKCRMLKSDSQVCTLDSDLLNKVEILEPYLRPMSSMTSDERFEYDELQHFYTHGLDFNVDEVDWLNAHHFDYRGLIEKGLALVAPEGMYETQKDEKDEEEIKIEIPKNLEEALSILNEMVSDEDKDYLKENGAISVHFSLGMWIRNNFGLWENSEFYEYLFNKVGLMHPDDMSNYVIEEFIKTL